MSTETEVLLWNAYQIIYPVDNAKLKLAGTCIRFQA